MTIARATLTLEGFDGPALINVGDHEFHKGFSGVDGDHVWEFDTSSIGAAGDIKTIHAGWLTLNNPGGVIATDWEIRWYLPTVGFPTPGVIQFRIDGLCANSNVMFAKNAGLTVPQFIPYAVNVAISATSIDPFTNDVNPRGVNVVDTVYGSINSSWGGTNPQVSFVDEKPGFNDAMLPGFCHTKFGCVYPIPNPPPQAKLGDALIKVEFPYAETLRLTGINGTSASTRGESQILIEGSSDEVRAAQIYHRRQARWQQIVAEFVS